MVTDIGDRQPGQVRAANTYDDISELMARRWRYEFPASSLPEHPAGGFDHAAGVAQRDAIRRAPARLSRQQRAVVVLRYAEDLSVAQTAEVLGCSPNTVKVQASRALAVLRADMGLRPSEIEE